MIDNPLTTEQRFLNLQLKELNISDKWRLAFLNFLPFRRMIILYPLQKRQIENISTLNIDEVYKIAYDVQDPTITLTDLEKLAIEYNLA